MLFACDFKNKWLRFPKDEMELLNWTPAEIPKEYSAKNQVLLGVLDCTYVWLENSSEKGTGGMGTKTHNVDHYSKQGYVKYLIMTAPNGRGIFAYGP